MRSLHELAGVCRVEGTMQLVEESDGVCEAGLRRHIRDAAAVRPRPGQGTGLLSDQVGCLLVAAPLTRLSGQLPVSYSAVQAGAGWRVRLGLRKVTALPSSGFGCQA